MGIQRHLKILMTFARKHIRDHDARYLRFIPRVMIYLLTVTRNYPEFSALYQYLRLTVQPALAKVVK
jgi:aminoglycoside/choline kinase family phosphotransferase